MSNYPFTWHELSEEERQERSKMWTAPPSCCVDVMRSEPMGVVMPRKFVTSEYHQRIWHLQPRPDDLWIVTYPKTGTTLTQELLWQLSTGVNLESEESSKNVFFRVPFLEMSCLASKGVAPVPSIELTDELKETMRMKQRMMEDTVAFTENLGDRRIIKTHLPLCMLPPNLLQVSRVVFVMRNVKDAAVSFFYHEKLLCNQGLDKSVSFESYAEEYMKGNILYGDYWAHLKDVWKHRGEKNLMVVRYEDMRSDFDKVIRELAHFTGFELTQEKLQKLKEHLDIDNFRKNDAVNMKPLPGSVPDEVRDNFNFIRKGKVGNWKEHFTNKVLLEKWDRWIEENNKDENGVPIDMNYGE